VIALARLAKIPIVEQKTALAELAGDESVLIDSATVPDLAAARFKVIDLRFAGGERLRYKSWHRVRIWRRA
jgi:hypothetical protein